MVYCERSGRSLLAKDWGGLSAAAGLELSASLGDADIGVEGRVEGRASGWAIMGRREVLGLEGCIDELRLGPSSLRRRRRAIAAVILVAVMIAVAVAVAAAVASSGVFRLGLCALETAFGFNTLS